MKKLTAIILDIIDLIAAIAILLTAKEEGSEEEDIENLASLI